jgi:hypothetical protein
VKTFLRTYWPHIFGSTVAAVVGVPAAVASYRHGMTVIERSSDPGMAPWLPMTTDGLLLASLVALWVRRLTGRATGAGPWAAFGLGLVAATATNLAGARGYIDHALDGWGVVEAIGWAVWPPICLAVVLEIVAWMVVPDRGQTVPVGGPTAVETGQTRGQTAVDQPKLTEEQIIAEVRQLGINPTRKNLHDRYGVGSGRAARIRAAVVTPVRLVPTGQTDDEAKHRKEA